MESRNRIFLVIDLNLLNLLFLFNKNLLLPFDSNPFLLLYLNDSLFFYLYDSDLYYLFNQFNQEDFLHFYLLPYLKFHIVNSNFTKLDYSIFYQGHRFQDSYFHRGLFYFKFSMKNLMNLSLFHLNVCD